VMQVAVLGLGAMGSAMAARLHDAGAELILWNRTRERAQALGERLGARVAATPAEAVANVAVALTSLADRRAVEDVFLGPDGVVAGARPGLLVAELSTVEPEVARAIAPELRAKGADILDVPVSGSVAVAREGGLTLMVGGEDASLDVIRPVLDIIGRRIFHLGPLGSGAAMKLAVNTVIHGLNAALAEGLVLAERAGIPRSLAYDVFASSAAGAPFVHYKRQAFEDPEHAPVDFRLALVRKDLELILALGEQTGTPLPQAAKNLDIVAAALDHVGDRDISALAVYLRGLASRSFSTDAAAPARRNERDGRTTPPQ